MKCRFALHTHNERQQERGREKGRENEREGVSETVTVSERGRAGGPAQGGLG